MVDRGSIASNNQGEQAAAALHTWFRPKAGAAGSQTSTAEPFLFGIVAVFPAAVNLERTEQLPSYGGFRM